MVFKSVASTSSATSAHRLLYTHFKALAASGLAGRVLGNRRLESKAHVPGEIDPGIL
jgi:hypothetical protein